MAYRIIADENIEPYTRQYLGKLGHDIEWIGDVSGLGLSSTDREIATYSRRENRLVLTQDDDFFTELDLDDSTGSSFRPTRHSPVAKSGTSSTRSPNTCHRPTSIWST